MDKNIQNLPTELQIEFIKSLIRETCYEGLKSICSTNSYFKNLCKVNMVALQPELNKCSLRHRLLNLDFDANTFDEKLIDYIANILSHSNRHHLLNSLSILRENNFPFTRGDSVNFIKNIAHMNLNDRKIFISFLVNLLRNLNTNSFIPFFLQISQLPIEQSKKEYLLALSCNLIGLNKVIQKILLNPDLNLSEPFLDFFVKNLKFSISEYLNQLDLIITGLREEINMISDPEDQLIMEEEYGPIIQKLERRMQILNQYSSS